MRALWGYPPDPGDGVGGLESPDLIGENGEEFREQIKKPRKD